MKTVTFQTYQCRPVITRHVNGGSLAIRLHDASTNVPVATATVNIPDFRLPPGGVLIKDRDENHGMVAALVAAGIVRDGFQNVPMGFSHARLCYLAEEIAA